MLRPTGTQDPGVTGRRGYAAYAWSFRAYPKTPCLVKEDFGLRTLTKFPCPVGGQNRPADGFVSFEARAGRDSDEACLVGGF